MIAPKAFPAIAPYKPKGESPFRTLEEVANATPEDYLSHSPKDPTQLALMMEMKAQRLFPITQGLGVIAETSYSFLYIGPGAGLVVHTLLERGHRASALETSRRGIASAPEGERSYINWAKPWELPFPSMKGEPPVPFKLFHIGIMNSYLKELLTKVEWNESLKELKKVCRYCATI